MKFIKRSIAMLLLMTMVVSIVGCGTEKTTDSTEVKNDVSNEKSNDGKEESKEQELLEYTYYYHDAEAAKWDNPNDVVTPYIEEKFNIRVKEVITPTSQTFKQMLNQWIAADNIPDVLNVSKSDADYAISTGKFADLTDYIPTMKNYNKYFDEKYWPWYKNDGKIYQIPSIQLNMSSDEYKDDPYSEGMFAWGLWVREDILGQLGYTFTPSDDIQKNIVDQGKKPTKEDLKIEPAIETPEDYYALLKKVKDLNLKVGDKSVIPLSITSWQQFHIGSMFDFGHWRIDENNNVDGFLGTPGAKDYYEFLNGLYQEGLIDKDFVLQKNEQLQEKVASGRVFSGMQVPDFNGAVQSMQTINPEARVRFIPWPKATEEKGFFDIYQPGFWRVIVRKDFEDIDRLVQYFDWFYSDEGLDIITWGPESAGLWEMKDGKKVFKDEQVENDVLNAVRGGKGAEFYGLYDYTNVQRSAYWSKAAMATPVLLIGNPKSYTMSYPPKQNLFNVSRNLLGRTGMDFKGIASYGDGGQNTSDSSSYFWSQFQNNKVAKLLIAETDSEFEKAWEEIYGEFLKKGKYEDAKKDMEAWFNEYGID